MKVNRNPAIYVGRNQTEASRKTEAKKTLFAGGLQKQGEAVFAKRQQARQKAMKVIGDTLAAEGKLDEEQEKRRDNVKGLTQQLHELEGYIADQKDVPEEEMSAEMKAAQQETIREYEKQYHSIQSEIKAELTAIEASKIERLKESPMVEAAKCADKIMEAAGKEIVDMLVQEAKENIEDKLEEKQEQAEKLAEKKEEEEERIAGARDDMQESEELMEQVKQAALSDAQKEIDEMLNKLKLIQEDIKGAAVDEFL